MSNGKKANVPKLRFPGFEEEWKQVKLGDVVTVGDGMDYKKLEKGDIPVYGTGGYMLSVNKALSYDKNAIGIGRKGTIDKPYILRAPFWTVDTLFYCIPNNDFSFGFVYGIFQKVNWKRKDESTGVPSLSKTNINSTTIAVPTIQEQNKIADLLTLIDERIAKQAQIVDRLKKYKRGLLKDVFSRKIHITKSDEEWNNQHIGDVLNILHGRDYKEFKNSNGKYPILGTSGIIDYSDKFLCNWSCVLIGRKGTIDRPQYMDTPFWTVDTLFYTKPKNGQNPKFQYYLFQTINWKRYNEASGIPSLSSSTIANIPICVPKIEVQNKIANFFTFLDKKMFLYESEFESLLNIKKALLQQMFI